MSVIGYCDECRFFDDSPSPGQLGTCRRRSPLPLVEHQLRLPAGDLFALDEVGAVWPTVDPSDWCGEYQPAARVCHTPPLDPGAA